MLPAIELINAQNRIVNSLVVNPFENFVKMLPPINLIEKNHINE